MTLYEELMNGLQSGIDAYKNGETLKTTVVELKDDNVVTLNSNDKCIAREDDLKEN
ncbi:MAG: hypothetical protein IJ815_06825 [Lachnospiraceae bacterium]|nr:hypothetical protein [Lachnospiraceae bacterium]